MVKRKREANDAAASRGRAQLGKRERDADDAQEDGNEGAAPAAKEMRLQGTYGNSKAERRTAAYAKLGINLLTAEFQAKQFPIDDIEDAMRPGQVHLLVGKRGSGKTWLIKALLYYMRLVTPYVFVFSHTKFTGFYHSILPDALIRSKFDAELIQQMMEVQKARRWMRGVNPHIILVLDDMASDSLLRYSQLMDQLLMEGRHYKITIIMATQHLKAASTKFRTNADKIYLFKTANKAILDCIKEEFGNLFVDDLSWEAWFMKNTQDQQAVVLDQRDPTVGPEDTYFVYKAPDLSNKEFIMGNFQAWGANADSRHHIVEEQRKAWRIHDDYAPSYMQRIKNKDSNVTREELNGQTPYEKKKKDAPGGLFDPIVK
jgi:energy-coupling factor transporter ATP-binding protein EcfA2